MMSGEKYYCPMCEKIVTLVDNQVTPGSTCWDCFHTTGTEEWIKLIIQNNYKIKYLTEIGIDSIEAWK